jgi:hypothetical protein
MGGSRAASRARWIAGAMGVPLVLLAGCAKTLPDQDRRITVAAPVAKMSADILGQEYQASQADANRKYWGQAILVSGAVTSVESAPPQKILFEPYKALGVEAHLLDDQATEILASVTVGQRVTLKCFCAGLSGRVILKSCVRP